MAAVAEIETKSVERRGNATDRVTTITDARGITYLTNTYCSGSCPLDPAVATQTLADGSVTRFDYVVVNQSVMQATVTDGRGNTTVHRSTRAAMKSRRYPVRLSAMGRHRLLTEFFDQ